MYTSYHSVNSSCTEGGVRLAGGETAMEGRVEVCHNQIWWAVSGYSFNWDFNDAIVVCRHLHYPANCKLCNHKHVLNFSSTNLFLLLCLQRCRLSVSLPTFNTCD